MLYLCTVLGSNCSKFRYVYQEHLRKGGQKKERDRVREKDGKQINFGTEFDLNFNSQGFSTFERDEN